MASKNVTILGLPLYSAQDDDFGVLLYVFGVMESIKTIHKVAFYLLRKSEMAALLGVKPCTTFCVWSSMIKYVP